VDSIPAEIIRSSIGTKSRFGGKGRIGNSQYLAIFNLTDQKPRDLRMEKPGLRERNYKCRSWEHENLRSGQRVKS